MPRCIICHMLQDGIKEKGICFDCWSEMDLQLYYQEMETYPSGSIQEKLNIQEEEE